MIRNVTMFAFEKGSLTARVTFDERTQIDRKGDKNWIFNCLWSSLAMSDRIRLIIQICNMRLFAPPSNIVP